MNATSEKNCLKCKWFSSYRNEYDDDPLEPDDCGRCKNSDALEKYDKDEFVHENEVCPDFENREVNLG